MVLQDFINVYIVSYIDIIVKDHCTVSETNTLWAHWTGYSWIATDGHIHNQAELSKSLLSW
jgi:hypothetical protein